MSKEVTIEVEPDNPVAQAVHDSESDLVTLVVDGERYRLVREEPTEWDADAMRAHLRRFSGFLTEAEAEKMKEEIYRAREEGSQHNFPE